MRSHLIPFVAFLLASGCASHEDPDGTSAKPPIERSDSGAKPKPQPAPVEIAVSSVYFSENCPDPEPPPAAAKKAPSAEKPSAGAPAEPMPIAEGDVAAGDSVDGAWGAGCSQSTMQLSLSSKAKSDLQIEIAEIRVRSADGKQKVGSLEARRPMYWDAAAEFKPWDGKLPPGELKATYRIGHKRWRKITRAMDSGMFVLEVDVKIGTELRTLVSPEFARAIPEEIVT